MERKALIYYQDLNVYFGNIIRYVSFQTVQPDQGFFFLTPFQPEEYRAA